MLMIFIWCQQDIMTSSCAKRQPLNRSYDLLFDASDVGHTLGGCKSPNTPSHLPLPQPDFTPSKPDEIG